MQNNNNKIIKGMEGVLADESQISKVIPESSELLYRGYPVAELAEGVTFEEVVYLLWEGELPSETQRKSFAQQERQNRPELDESLTGLLESLKGSHPMDALRTVVSFCGAKEECPWDESLEQRRQKALRLLAGAPVFTAAHFRLSKGLAPIPADRSLGFSENFLKMCFGEKTSAEKSRLFDSSMILYAEHGFNASTFTARVIASTTSDIVSAVTGAIGALKGPLHGGANEKVMEMMQTIKSPDRAEAYVLNALSKRQKIMGFGHRVYRKEDSRVPFMEKCARRLSELKHELVWMEIYDILKTAMQREKNIYPNVDLPAGPAYHLMGFETNLFTALFVISRIAGWCAHIMEQGANNRIIRPLSVYTGPKKRSIVQA